MSKKPAKRLIEPDFWTCPHGKRTRPEAVLTYGPEVADVCAAADFTPDAQQQLGLDLIFAINPDGSPACFEFCVICSRQNLKTGLFLQAAIGWLYVLDVPEVVWSAHEMSTTRSAQRDLGNLIKGSPTLRKRMLPQKNDGIYDANGEERIELRGSGGLDQIIWYKARTRDGGRGLARPKLILDEAFALRWAMMGALIPILLAQHDPQVLYGSSPAKADSEVLHDICKRGKEGTTPGLSFLAWGLQPLPPCKDGDDCEHPKTGFALDAPCSLNRTDLVLRANPTAVATDRISIETLAAVRQILDSDEWVRECMGVEESPNTGAAAIFGAGRWEACAADIEIPEHPVAIGVAVSVDRTAASIACSAPVEVLSDPEDLESEPITKTLVAPVDRRDGVRWLIKALQGIQKRHPDAVIVIDEKGPTGDLLDDFGDNDIGVEGADLSEYAEACSRFFDKVRSHELVHTSAPELDGAVEVAEWRWTGGDRRVWGRKQSTGDISMLEAATLADYGAEKFGAFNIY